MTRTIKVFIKTKWKIEPYASTSRVWVHGGRPPEQRMERIISKSDAEILKTLEELAKKKGLDLEVHDLATPRGWLSASFNRIKKTPAVIFNDQRIEAIESKDQLLHAMKERHIS